MLLICWAWLILQKLHAGQHAKIYMEEEVQLVSKYAKYCTEQLAYNS